MVSVLAATNPASAPLNPSPGKSAKSHASIPADRDANAPPETDTPVPKSARAPLTKVGSATEIQSKVLSAEGVHMARQLQMLPQLQRLEQLRAKQKENLSADEKEELRDIRQEIEELIEQTRLEVAYAQAELAVEVARQGELVRSYQHERDNRVNWSNVWSFRTNGALWSVAEALTIPTYVKPRYAIPSGIVGILAGLVPTAFSMLALHESEGGKIQREAYPNMLTKIFGYPATHRVDYPESVWVYLHTPPTEGKSGKSRIDLLIDQWLEDENISILKNRNSKAELDLLTGSVKQKLTIDLLSDRVTMLTQLDALIGLMNRPLLELMMCLRGHKHLPAELTP